MNYLGKLQACRVSTLYYGSCFMDMDEIWYWNWMRRTSFLSQDGSVSLLNCVQTRQLAFLFQQEQGPFCVPKHPEQNCSLSSLIPHQCWTEAAGTWYEAHTHVSLSSYKVNAWCYKNIHLNTLMVIFLDQINPLGLELDIYSLAHHLCAMWIFYEPRRVTLRNTRRFVEE